MILLLSLCLVVRIRLGIVVIYHHFVYGVVHILWFVRNCISGHVVIVKVVGNDVVVVCCDELPWRVPSAQLYRGLCLSVDLSAFF